jgi:hypothetical protein
LRIDWDTLEKLSIVRTLPNAPDLLLRFRSFGGLGYFGLCFRNWVFAGSQESFDLNP